MHQLQPRHILTSCGKAVTEQALHSTLTVQLGIAPTKSDGEAYPAEGIPFHKQGGILWHKKVRHPTQWSFLQLFHGRCKGVLHRVIKDASIFECHPECGMAHQLLEGR